MHCDPVFMPASGCFTSAFTVSFIDTKDAQGAPHGRTHCSAIPRLRATRAVRSADPPQVTLGIEQPACLTNLADPPLLRHHS
jgi:hypothetical protein